MGTTAESGQPSSRVPSRTGAIWKSFPLASNRKNRVASVDSPRPNRLRHGDAEAGIVSVRNVGLHDVGDRPESTGLSSLGPLGW